MKKALLLVILLPILVIGGVKGFIYYQVTSQLNGAIAAVSPFVSVSYSDVTSTLDGEVRVEGVKIKAYGTDLTVTIDEVGVKFPDLPTLLFIGDDLKKQTPPERMGLKLNHVRMDLQTLEPYMRMLQSRSDQPLQRYNLLGCGDLEKAAPLSVLRQLGYSELDGSMTLGYRWERAAKRLVIDSDARWHEMSGSTVSIELEQIASLTPAALLRAPVLKSISVSVDDEGYNPRLLQHCATSQNISKADYINIHIASLKAALAQQGIRPGENLFGVYRYYLNDEGPLTFKMSPGSLQQLSNLDMFKPRDIPALLALEIHKGGEIIRDIEFDWDQVKFKETLASLAERPVVESETVEKSVEQERSGPRYVELNPSMLDTQLHQILQITSTDKRQLEGRLIKTSEKQIFIDVPMGGGTATLPITRSDITRVKVRVNASGSF